MQIRYIVLAAAAALALTPAWAGHVKPGLWKLTTTVRFVGVDKFPPMVTGKLASQGIVFPKRPQTTEKTVCIKPEDAAIDRLPRQSEDNGSCNALAIVATADGYEGTAVCSGDFNGRLWYNVAFTGDAHYEGKLVFKGNTYGLALETWTKFSGDLAGADCSVAPAQ